MSARWMRELRRKSALAPSFSITPTGVSPDGTIEYDFHCLECGGYILSAEEPLNRHSKASCKACGLGLGTLWDLEKELRKKIKMAGVEVKPGIDFPDET